MQPKNEDNKLDTPPAIYKQMIIKLIFYEE